MKQLINILFLALCQLSMGQNIGFETIDESKVKDWLPKLIIEYQGLYHFGDSEGESTLLLLFTGNKIIAQIKSGSWSNDGKWIWTFKNLTNVMIEDGRFSSDEYSGNFVRYQDGEQDKKGLKINNPWSVTFESGNYEIGIRTSTNVKLYFPGAYKEASTKRLSDSDVNTMHPDELKIMRNEIFARYGYIFKKGGEMEKYFKPQAWYQPQHENVDSILTTIEKMNIQTILKEEKR